jgi:hypothetical protein
MATTASSARGERVRLRRSIGRLSQMRPRAKRQMGRVSPGRWRPGTLRHDFSRGHLDDNGTRRTSACQSATNTFPGDNG